MRKAFFLNILTLFLFITVFTTFVEARSGCCSHHNGVCGCSCCDGTPLSSTCAPYYPQCNRGGSVQGEQESKPVYIPPTSIPWPTWTPIPTKTPIRIITPTTLPTLTPTITPKPKIKKVKEKKVNKKTQKKSFWQWLFGK